MQRKRCNNGHPLIWYAINNYPGNRYQCDLCGTIGFCSEGRWHCIDCQYDSCKKCIKPPNKNFLCDKGHSITWIKSPKLPGKNVICTNCSNEFDHSTGCWGCEDCRSNICYKCRPKPGFVFLVDSSLPSCICQCDQYHTLEWDKEEEGANMFNCKICKKSGDCLKGRWCCFECQYNICNECRSFDGTTSLPPVILPVCNMSHALRWIKAPNNEETKECKCELCKMPIEIKNGRWLCVGCNYNICSKCNFLSESNNIKDACTKFGTPTVCMGRRNPKGIGYNDYLLFVEDKINNNELLKISAVEIYTEKETNNIIQILVKYEGKDLDGKINNYKTKHGEEQNYIEKQNRICKSIDLSKNECIKNIKGKFKEGRINQLIIETIGENYYFGNEEGNDFDLKVPKDKIVIAIASEFEKYMNCIGAYWI